MNTYPVHNQPNTAPRFETLDTYLPEYMQHRLNRYQASVAAGSVAMLPMIAYELDPVETAAESRPGYGAHLSGKLGNLAIDATASVGNEVVDATNILFQAIGARDIVAQPTYRPLPPSAYGLAA